VSAATPSLDHVGYVTHSLDALRDEMLRLGFAPTEPRELLAVDAATGVPRRLGQRSCHAVFERGYIELTSVDTPSPSHHLATWLARGAGLHILALGSERIATEQARCTAAGLDVTAPAQASRRIEYGERHGDARFEWFMFAPGESPEGLLCYAHNLTPELVYQPSVQRHPNGALALGEVVVRCADLPTAVAHWRRRLGFAPRVAAAGARFELGGGAVTLCDAARCAERFGPLAPAAPIDDGFAATVVQVRDLDHCERLLRNAGVDPLRRSGQLVVRLQSAGGALLVFE
jgi:hypothetical protein